MRLEVNTNLGSGATFIFDAEVLYLHKFQADLFIVRPDEKDVDRVVKQPISYQLN